MPEGEFVAAAACSSAGVLEPGLRQRLAKTENAKARKGENAKTGTESTRTSLVGFFRVFALSRFRVLSLRRAVGLPPPGSHMHERAAGFPASTPQQTREGQHARGRR